MRALLAIPLTILIVAAYNFMAFQNLAGLEAAAVTTTLMSGATVVITWGDGLVAVGLLVLFIEMLKAARVGSATILKQAFHDSGLPLVHPRWPYPFWNTANPRRPTTTDAPGKPPAGRAGCGPDQRPSRSG